MKIRLSFLAFAAFAALSTLAQSQVFDDFDGTEIDTSKWNIVDGTWSQSNGQITGYWPGSDAYGEQGNLLLAAGSQPSGDFSIEADMVVQPFGQDRHGCKIVLYSSPGNKYNINYDVEGGRLNAEVKQDGGIYRQIGDNFYPDFDTTVGAINRATVVKSGNLFRCYLNGQEVFTLTDSVWTGNVRVGIGAYNYAVYDRVSVIAVHSSTCFDRGADVNCDGVEDVFDVIYLIDYVFSGGPPRVLCPQE